MKLVTAAGRLLPAGWRDLGRQLAIWFGFLGAYQLVRGLGGGDRSLALAHGDWVIHTEQRLGNLFELTVQGFATTSNAVGNGRVSQAAYRA